MDNLTIKAAGVPNHPETLAKGDQIHVPSYHPAPQPKSMTMYWSLIAGITLVLVLGCVVWGRKRA